MKRNRIAAFILAGFILLLLVICGVIGYLSDSGRAAPKLGFADNQADFTDTPNAIDLVYCNSPVSLCIVSFGQDNAGNLLIVVRNNIPGLKEFYAKLHSPEMGNFSTPEALNPTPILTPEISSTETLEVPPTETASPEPTRPSDLYPCQKVQFATDIYYCVGSLISDGTIVTMDVYSKSDDRLVASGEIIVSAEATPAPTTTEGATATVSPFETETPTATVFPTEATEITPAYPYSYP